MVDVDAKGQGAACWLYLREVMDLPEISFPAALSLDTPPHSRAKRQISCRKRSAHYQKEPADFQETAISLVIPNFLVLRPGSER